MRGQSSQRSKTKASSSALRGGLPIGTGIIPATPIMSNSAHNISHEEIVELQKKFSEIKHAINNALAVMMALSEMSQRRPDYSEKLASTVLTKAPQIVSSLQEFTQALNEKAGPKPEVGHGNPACPWPAYSLPSKSFPR